MKIKTKLDWHSGLGSELLTAAIAIVVASVIVWLCILFGSYNAEIQAQVIADIIADGSCAFAKTEMNVAEKPLEEMAKKLFDANSGLNNGVELVSGTPSVEIKSYSEYGDAGIIKNSYEKTTLEKRGIIMKGTLQTEKFDIHKTGVVKNLVKELYNDGETEYLDPVHYDGPRYMDQFVTVSVSAQYHIPFLSELTERTKSATTISMGVVPYNSRSSYPASPTLNAYSEELESLAFSDGIKYGSIQQKVLLEARRALGDGYSMSNKKNGQWPNLPRLFGGTESSFNVTLDNENTFNGDNAKNYLKDCYAFVNSCFKVDGLYGLTDAFKHIPHISISRSIEYAQSITPEELWEMMHSVSKPIRLYSNSTSIFAPLYWMNLPEWFRNKASLKHPYYSYHSGGKFYFHYMNKKGTLSSEIINDPNKTWYYDKKTGKLVNSTSKTLAELVELYGRNSPLAEGSTENFMWHVVSADPWSVDDLQIGDVLEFADPNWLPYVAKELSVLAALETKDQDVFDSFSSPVGTYCHIGIYVGDGKMIDCTENGVSIRPLKSNYITYTSGMSGSLLCGIYRFDDFPLYKLRFIGNENGSGLSGYTRNETSIEWQNIENALSGE